MLGKGLVQGPLQEGGGHEANEGRTRREGLTLHEAQPQVLQSAQLQVLQSLKGTLAQSLSAAGVYMESWTATNRRRGRADRKRRDLPGRHVDYGVFAGDESR